MSISISIPKNFSNQTSLFGLKLWIILVAFTLLFTLLFLFLVFLCLLYLCRRKSKSSKSHFRLPDAISYQDCWNTNNASSLDKRLLSSRLSEIEMNIPKLVSPQSSGISTIQRNGNIVSDRYSVMVPDAWRGNRFSLRDIDVVTNGFSDENLIGNGEFSVVYRGILLDATRVAVKRLFCKSGIEVEDFVNEVELIGHVRHKNLTKLLGFCTEGGFRMLVNEYVDNGNLYQWLHGCQEQFSPLTWNIRMNIIQGIAKGLAYLHEDIEPKIVHQNLKSTNILLDHQWNPKISDFGIVQFFDTEAENLATSSGYLPQEFASNGVLNEKTDVYSFGILVMEIICGRTPVDHNQPQVYLIDWLKSMVANQKIMFVADPKLAAIPSLKYLKRILCLALRCVDPDIKHRPSMGEVIHMLEPRDLLLSDFQERRIRRDASSHRSCSQDIQIIAKSGDGNSNTLERESSSNVYQKIMPSN